MIYVTLERDGRRAQPFLKNITLSLEGEGRVRVTTGYNKMILFNSILRAGMLIEVIKCERIKTKTCHIAGPAHTPEIVERCRGYFREKRF
jgi:hypothetical protein